MALIRLRRGTTEEWETYDPVLRDGEPGVDLDRLTIRVGDGKTRYSELYDMTGPIGPEGPDGEQGPPGPAGPTGLAGLLNAPHGDNPDYPRPNAGLVHWIGVATPVNAEDWDFWTRSNL